MDKPAPIVTLKERCRKCYSCVRHCPVKAVKVEPEHAEIIYERCIGCGNCLSACPQKARTVSDAVALTEGFLTDRIPVVAVLGCSFPAFFHDVSPGQLVAGLRKLGFAEVHEGAYGAELIAPSYAALLRSGNGTWISSHCPAIVDLIERHHPELIPMLAPVVSPMIAMGRYLRNCWDARIRVVYLSSCVAGKFEIASPEAAGAVDAVLTYRELGRMFRARSIDLKTLDEEPFSGVEPKAGRLFPVAGGVFRALSLDADPFDTSILGVEGEVNALGVIGDLVEGRIAPHIVDIRFCYGGCIGGPGKNKELTEFYKRNLVISHSRRFVRYRTHDRYRVHRPLPYQRGFASRHVPLEHPKGAEVREILRSTNKVTAKDELNCRACGYSTCREYAVAVYQGLADLDMCLPFNLQQLEEDRGRLIQKYELARRELDREYSGTFMVGNDRKTLEVLDLIKRVAPTPTTVLIRGESGTGKELTARAIHSHSARNDKPLVTVNCTTLTDSLLEAELFGHRKGAFTGAVADRKGLFEAADGGTIFLDEVGDITPKLQAELLRVLDSGDVRPVGSTITKKVDVRLITATNRNLEEGVRDGWFREDLYYRLNVFSITMPPLRSRLESIPVLAHHFLVLASKKLNKKIVGIEDRAIACMMRYPWPGNIREMQNIIERAAVLTHDKLIRLENLPSAIRELDASSAAPPPGSLREERERKVTSVEKELIQKYLAESGGNVSQAALAAGIPRRTFYRLLTKYGFRGATS